MTADSITFWNTGVPLTVAGALGWAVPRFISPARTRSHWRVAIAVAASTLVIIMLCATLYAMLQPEKFARAADMGGLFLAIEIAVRGSILFAFAWAPILLWTWLGLAQRVEYWRGKDMAAREGP
ncbi:hypothetical protein [Tateyamaria sp. SN6-1]|uniref:hypothetical protein n=1 Tax=Tateyamaria sp. SN6-1 TaxID=3092148 RepID=UPI0039F4A343